MEHSGNWRTPCALRSHHILQTETKEHESLCTVVDFDICGFLLMTNLLTEVGLGMTLTLLHYIYCASHVLDWSFVHSIIAYN